MGRIKVDRLDSEMPERCHDFFGLHPIGITCAAAPKLCERVRVAVIIPMQRVTKALELSLERAASLARQSAYEICVPTLSPKIRRVAPLRETSNELHRRNEVVEYAACESQSKMPIGRMQKFRRVTVEKIHPLQAKCFFHDETLQIRFGRRFDGGDGSRTAVDECSGVRALERTQL